MHVVTSLAPWSQKLAYVFVKSLDSFQVCSLMMSETFCRIFSLVAAPQASIMGEVLGIGHWQG